ncbi:hypothetical protein FQN57_006818 [Myotisia sp. PD_48]|nr:hypothetical protein FQN57_006818 [Myotisia sp. PD_48]
MASSTTQNESNDAPAAPQPYTIQGANHTGFTVTNIDRSIDFWHKKLQLPLLYSIVLDGDMISEVTGVEKAKVALAMVMLPNGHGIELLEYRNDAENATYKPKSCDVGSVHIALNVQGLDALVDSVNSEGWARVGKTQTIEGGVLDGTRVVYIRGPDGETVELMESPLPN